MFHFLKFLPPGARAPPPLDPVLVRGFWEFAYYVEKTLSYKNIDFYGILKRFFKNVILTQDHQLSEVKLILKLVLKIAGQTISVNCDNLDWGSINVQNPRKIRHNKVYIYVFVWIINVTRFIIFWLGMTSCVYCFCSISV